MEIWYTCYIYIYILVYFISCKLLLSLLFSPKEFSTNTESVCFHRALPSRSSWTWPFADLRRPSMWMSGDLRCLGSFGAHRLNVFNHVFFWRDKRPLFGPCWRQQKTLLVIWRERNTNMEILVKVWKSVCWAYFLYFPCCFFLRLRFWSKESNRPLPQRWYCNHHDVIFMSSSSQQEIEPYNWSTQETHSVFGWQSNVVSEYEPWFCSWIF